MADIENPTDDILGLDEPDDDKSYDQEFSDLQGLIKGRFIKSEDSRLFDESRWLRGYRNYRGIYGSDMSFTEKEKSRVFVKITNLLRFCFLLENFQLE